MRCTGVGRSLKRKMSGGRCYETGPLGMGSEKNVGCERGSEERIKFRSISSLKRKQK